MVKRKKRTDRYDCISCGNSRVKAKTISGKVTPLKLCQKCYDSKKSQIFYSSSFGIWLQQAYQRQYTNNVPQDNEKLSLLYILWLRSRTQKGFYYDGETFGSKYEYQLCHIIGASHGGNLLADNLVIAPRKVNRDMGATLPLWNHSQQQLSPAQSLNCPESFKLFCKNQYNLEAFVSTHKLTQRTGNKSGIPEFYNAGVNPALSLSITLERLGYQMNNKVLPSFENEEAINTSFHILLYAHPVFVYWYVMQNGINHSEPNLGQDEKVKPLNKAQTLALNYKAFIAEMLIIRPKDKPMTKTAFIALSKHKSEVAEVGKPRFEVIPNQTVPRGTF